jgi:catechol 2,3-dioxygenase-like lactoylglutathione lyase family enzyme
MEHVGIVVDDLAAATAFFGELGLRLQGEWPVEGAWVDRVVKAPAGRQPPRPHPQREAAWLAECGSVGKGAPAGTAGMLLPRLPPSANPA